MSDILEFKSPLHLQLIYNLHKLLKPSVSRSSPIMGRGGWYLYLCHPVLRRMARMKESGKLFSTHIARRKSVFGLRSPWLWGCHIPWVHPESILGELVFLFPIFWERPGKLSKTGLPLSLRLPCIPGAQLPFCGICPTGSHTSVHIKGCL